MSGFESDIPRVQPGGNRHYAEPSVMLDHPGLLRDYGFGGNYLGGHGGVYHDPFMMGGGFGRGYVSGMNDDHVFVPMFGNRADLDRERAVAGISHAELQGKSTGQGIGVAGGAAIGAGIGALVGFGIPGAFVGAIVGGTIGFFAGGAIGEFTAGHRQVMADVRYNGRLDGNAGQAHH